jgi:hypothetical protein
MRTKRQLNRRSFLAQVSGGALAATALGLIAGTRSARAQTGPWTGVTDTDSGSYADNAGHGRGPGGNRSGQPGRTGVTDRDPTDPSGGGRGTSTGYSDSDSGPNADPSGGGRRGRQQSGVTDSDPTDSYGQGRGRGSGGGTTRPNQRRPDGRCVHHTGNTDSDSGAIRDPSGYGHGGRHGSNLLPDVHCN